MSDQALTVGMEVDVFERSLSGKKIDTVIIRSITNEKIKVESKDQRSERTEFVLYQGEWRMLHEDPFSGRMVVSLRAPSYVFKPC